MKTIEVVAAIIRNENQILCVQRGKNKHAYTSLKYEFPGGKVEPGETREGALKREIMEELGLPINELKFFMTVNHTYPDFHITMHCFECTCQTRELQLLEHVDALWLDSAQIRGLDWAAADIPVVNEIVLKQIIA